MTRRLLSITLAVLTVGLLGSCAKINDRIDSLEGRIDRIESDRIASIDQQIAAINSSISDLGTIRQNIQNLIDTTDGQEKDINFLKTADASLGQRIDELKAYTDETLKAYAKSDWVKATFATLEQHEWTCDTVAKIDARIGKLDKKLTESIKDSEASLRSWVNAQMESYYTAAQMDAKLAELLTEIATASGESQAKADSLAKELKEAKSAIATVKTELTEAYQSAIEKAIKTSEGKLTSKISSSVSSVNSKVSALADRVGDLEDKVDDLTDRIKALEGRIQSVTIIPAYSDGGVMEKDGTLTVDFVVSPAKAVVGVTKDNIKVLVNTVKTKAATFTTVPAATATINKNTGYVSITANISSITVGTGQALTVAVNISNDISDFTTEFVPVVVNVTSVSLNKSELELSISDTQTLTATVLPENASNKKVTWSSSDNNIATVDATGKVTAVAAGTATITVTTADGSKTNTCTVKVTDSCVAAGTMITMGNGAQKVVEEIEIGDVIRTFDHETGNVSSAPVCFVWKTENASNAFTLTFEGGTEVKVIEEHGFYDKEERKYAFINANNAKGYIGHHFYDADNGRWLELKGCKLSNESVDAYAIITSGHLNHLSNGILSMCDGSVKVLANIFEYDEQMRFDADKKAADIAAYGLTPLEKILEYKGFLEADYYDYNLQYLNVAIGKGLTSWDYVKALSDYCEANGIY